MNESLKQEQTLTVTKWPTQRTPASVLDSARRAIAMYRAEALAGCLLLLMAASLLNVIQRKSITTDEIVVIPSAYYHLVGANFQLVHELPPLCKLTAAIPLLFIQPDEIKPQAVATAATPTERASAYEVSFWRDNRALFHSISFWTRIPAILLTLLVGVVIFRFARELFGARAAVMSLFLFTFEPTVLAHGRVAHTDIPATLGFLLVCYALYRYIEGRTWRRALWVGAAAGLALLGKFSMVIVAPLLLLVFLALLWRARKQKSSDDGRWAAALIRHACLAVLASLAVVNAAYYFHSRALSEADAQWVAESFPSAAHTVWQSVRMLRHLVPTDFVLGVYWQLWHSSEGHPASLLGMYSQHGWWYYFPIAFALKTTLPFLILSVASLVWAVYRSLVRHERLFLIPVIPLALYTAFVMASSINIGVRYFLPAYPFLFILGGAFLDRLLGSKRMRRAGAIAALLLVGWVGVEAVRAYPNHMSYMNQLAWSRPHWYYLSDSNVEWGDDVRELAEYLRARGETRARAMLLGGYMTLNYYGVEYLDAMALTPSEQPETRYVAIGASFLNGSTVPGRAGLSHYERVNFFDAYRQRTPEAVIGGSIYLYRMRE